jgi:ribosome-binding factor A
MRFIPELLFRFDATVERGAHIMELLHELEEGKGKKDPTDE